MSTLHDTIDIAPLDPLRFPLRGSRLIEASAGTGKTFTIAMLYLRLVLDHGDAHAFGRALTPPEILVVTFTEAATQELRDRIRQRLAEAAALFRIGEDDPAFVDEPDSNPLRALRNDYPAEQWPACARKLQLAAEWMDEAAVSTIHGWCNRMLREHAFDSDSLFTQALETDQRDLHADVARDYWRSFMLPLEVRAVEDVRGWWRGPDALQTEARKLMEHAAQLPTVAAPAESLRDAAAARERLLAELKAPWAEGVDALEALCDDAVARKLVDGRKLQARYYEPWCQALRDWAADPAQVRPDLKTGWSRLTPEGFAEIWKVGEPPAHPGLAAIAHLAQTLDHLPDARLDVLRHAARWMAARFEAEQARRAQMGFNDLLTRLDAALQGANGERLAEIIRRQFPVALIDEFQDTDPVQYRIFDAIYRVADPVADTALILIGDPKQAIYAFRGADIFTYLAARRAVDGRLSTLKRNFRSTPGMVAAANAVFAGAEALATRRGAFLFRSGKGNPVPFVPAEANGRKDLLLIDGEPLAASLTAWWLAGGDDGKPVSKTAYQSQLAAGCAGEIVRLLNLGRGGRAVIAAGDQTKPLSPRDIAVLVNSRREAEAVRTALAARGVRSVYLSDKDSVLQSPQAAELQLWLTACAEPDDPRSLRAALATATLGLGWETLDALNRDEITWENRVLQFRGYRDCWRRQGVLPMLRRLLHDFDVPGRLLGTRGGAAVQGERVLTDLLHLAELLQQASVLLDGEHALIRHLAEQRQDEGAGGGAGDARQIRLESDADIVTVVTVHKSKGLEYPLVFLPYANACRPVDKPGELPLLWHDANGTLQMALEADADIVQRIDQERLGEDLRKLYVALTRAQHATWIGLAPLVDFHRSAVGYLLGQDDPVAGNGLAALLDTAFGQHPDIAVAPAPAASTDTLAGAAAPATLGAARRPVRPVRDHWWVASYSAINTPALDSPDTPAAETAEEDVVREVIAAARDQLDASDEAPGAAPVETGASTGLLHDFPRGAEAGTFLHDLLEWSASQGFAQVAANRPLVREIVARRCQVRGWERYIEPLTDWLLGLLVTPLHVPARHGMAPASFSLAGLHTSVAEMEFWMATHTVAAETLDRLVCTHTLDGASRPAIQPRQLNGMFKGFIDLAFEHEGRYYVADYKSNWLGDGDAAYTPAALQTAILQSRYDLQYVLYVFALHRQLKIRLPDYDFDAHIGGAVYLFLRGSEAPGQGLHVEKPPRALIEALDALFSGQAREAA